MIYKKNSKNSRRAKKILKLMLGTGNLGHNVDDSYKGRKSLFAQKCTTLWIRFKEYMRLMTIFPVNAPFYFLSYAFHHTKASL